jgi:hypothetical protein
MKDGVEPSNDPGPGKSAYRLAFDGEISRRDLCLGPDWYYQTQAQKPHPAEPSPLVENEAKTYAKQS